MPDESANDGGGGERQHLLLCNAVQIDMEVPVPVFPILDRWTAGLLDRWSHYTWRAWFVSKCE